MEFNGWNKVKLGEIIELNPRLSLKKEELAKKVAMEHISEFTRKVQEYEKTKFKGGSKFQNGDTLMARITPCLENGKTAFVDVLDGSEIGFGSTEFFVLRAKEGVADPKFIYYLSISEEIRKVVIQSMTGTSGRQRAQKEALLNFEKYIPSIDIQRQISTILSSLDDKIELNNEIVKSTEQLAQTLFKRWFIDFEFPNEDNESYKSSGGEMIESDLGEIPENWTVKSLVEIANYKNGLAMQKYRPKNAEKTLPVMKIKELNQGFIGKNSERCIADIKESVKVYNGDVIFSWSGTLLVKIWVGGNAGLNQHLFKVTSEHFPKWFYYCWTKYYLNRFIAIAADKATTMGHISLAPNFRTVNNYVLTCNLF